jgi:HEAT repeat protein
LSDHEAHGAAQLAALLVVSDPALRADALARLAERTRRGGPTAIDATIAHALLVPLGSASRTEQRHTADLMAPLVAGAPALLAVLRQALAAPEARLRWGAAYTLGRALPPGPELWPSALETMRLDDGDQRWAAAELACRIARSDPEVRHELRRALDDPSPTLRKMVLYCLRDLRDPATSASAGRLLADADAGVRLAALAALAAVGPAQAADPEQHRAAHDVATLLASDPDAGVRRAAAATLGKLGIAEPAIVEALSAATGAPDASLARAARGSLRALGMPG